MERWGLKVWCAGHFDGHITHTARGGMGGRRRRKQTELGLTKLNDLRRREPFPEREELRETNGRQERKHCSTFA